MIGQRQCHGSLTESMVQSILEKMEEIFAKQQISVQEKMVNLLKLGEIINENLIIDMQNITDWHSPFRKSLLKKNIY